MGAKAEQSLYRILRIPGPFGRMSNVYRPDDLPIVKPWASFRMSGPRLPGTKASTRRSPLVDARRRADGSFDAEDRLNVLPEARPDGA